MGYLDKPLDLGILVEDNIRTLNLPKGKLNPPIAVILVGIPASGKTFLVQRLAQALPLAVLSEERMLRFLAPKISFFKRAQEEVITLAAKTVEKLILRGVSCIFDYSVKKRDDRDFIKKSVETSVGKLILILLDIPKEEAYKKIGRSNYAVSGGEKKGVIMNRDLFEYEVASTNFPASSERAMVFKPNHPDSLDAIIDQISTIANQPR